MPAATSAAAAPYARYAEFDLGAVASITVAFASGIDASGSPSLSADSTQACVIAAAIGYARPTSSLAITCILLQAERRSPPESSFAR